MSIKYKGRILVIDDEAEIGWIFSKILSDKGYEVISSQTGRDGLNKVRKFMPDLVFVDLKLPDRSGVHILKEIKTIESHILVIMITAHETIQTAVESMKLGAYEYITKPINFDHMFLIIDRILELKQLQEHNRDLQLQLKSRFRFEQIIGKSPKLQTVFSLVRDVAETGSTVLIRGENGTGKELIANAIYKLSKRKDKPIPLRSQR